MDFHMWVTYTDHRLAQYAVIAGQGVPFNIAHAVGNVLFCLAFGPALVRALGRFRDRSEITWHPAPAATAVLVAVAAVLLVAPPAGAADRTVQRAVTYLQSVQTADGGFASAKGGKQANEMQSGWVIMGLAAAGRHPSTIRNGGRSAAAYIRARAREVSYAGDMSRTLLALRAAGQPTGALAAKLEGTQRASGSVIGLVNQTAFAILALRAAGRPTGHETVRSGADYVLSEQNPDGGWNFGGKGAPSGVDDTAAVVQALVAAGRGSSAQVKRAVTWLLGKQAGDGGFSLTRGTGSNSQSTAWAVQALVAAGKDARKVRRKGSRTPIEFLRSLQNPDGSIRYSRTSRQTPVWVTGQVLAALAGKPMPVKAPKKQRRPKAKAAQHRPAFAHLGTDLRSVGAFAALLLAPIVA
jgi:energy-coupling factor transport system substrate-specific component